MDPSDIDWLARQREWAKGLSDERLHAELKDAERRLKPSNKQFWLSPQHRTWERDVLRDEAARRRRQSPPLT